MKKRIIYGLVVVLVLLVFTNVFIYFYHKPIEQRSLEASFFVRENAGFDLNSTALTFGAIPRGGSSSRSVTIDNDYERNVRVDVKVSRDIADYVFADQPIYLSKGESANVSFSAIVPEDMPYGNYSGFVYFDIFEN